MSRRKARESALNALYQLEIVADEDKRIVEECGSILHDDALIHYSTVIQGVQDKNNQVESVITKFLKKGWTLDRLSILDRAILKLAVYELMFKKDTPSGVVLNEAIELAKIYSSIESSRFINGILGECLKHIER